MIKAEYIPAEPMVKIELTKAEAAFLRDICSFEHTIANAIAPVAERNRISKDAAERERVIAFLANVYNGLSTLLLERTK